MAIRAAVGAIVLFVNSGGAYAENFTYSQWAALRDDRQAIYIAGAIDMLTDFTPDAASPKHGAHYNRCILDGKMTNGELSQNILMFARSFPDVQKLSAQAVLIQYLNRLCGLLH